MCDQDVCRHHVTRNARARGVRKPLVCVCVCVGVWACVCVCVCSRTYTHVMWGSKRHNLGARNRAGLSQALKR